MANIESGINTTPQDHSEDLIAKEAADAARKMLEYQARHAGGNTLLQADNDAHNAKHSSVVDDNGSTFVKIPGIGTFAGVTTTEKIDNDRLKVTDHVAAFPPKYEQGMSDFFGIEPKERIEAMATESIAPRRKFGLPDREKAEVQRISKITSAKQQLIDAEMSNATPDGAIVPGTDAVHEETVHGSRRIVHRKITSGQDKKGETVIVVEQNSTDIDGENPRSRTWKHSADAPSATKKLTTGTEIDEASVARRIARRGGERIFKKQLRQGGIMPPKSGVPIRGVARRSSSK